MGTLSRNLLYAFRTLRKNPAYTAVAIMTLTLVIAANTVIFSLLNGVLLEPLPYREPDRLVILYEKRPQQGRVRNVVSAPDFVDWKQQNTVFEDMAALGTGFALNLNGPTGPERLDTAMTSANFFQVLGVRPQLGRLFLPEEEQSGKDRVVLLNHGLWQRAFGGDPKIVGRTVTLSGESYTVVGVLPDIPSVFPSETEIWKPLVIVPQMGRGGHFLGVFARLKHGVTLAQAKSDMDGIAERLEKQYPNENTGHGVNLFAMHDEVTGGVRSALFILMGAVGLLLMIACANIANLALVRASRRRREIAVRTALGAGRWGIAQQLLTESLLLSVLGGSAGFLIAHWAVRALALANPGNIPRLNSIAIDRPVLLFTIVISVAAGIIFGLGPAMYGFRTKLGEVLNERGRGSTEGLGRNRARAVLVVAQIALAVLLSIGAALMMQSFVRLAGVSPGFDVQNVLTVELFLVGPKYSEPAIRSAFFEQLLIRVRSLPGVLSAGATTSLPLTGQDAGNSIVIEGRPQVRLSELPIGRNRVVSPGYFETMRIPLRSGRLISDEDSEKAKPVVMISETMARSYWPNENPIGKRLRFPTPNITWREIVGIVADVKHYSLNGETRPEMYFPYMQQPLTFMTIVARTRSAPELLAPLVRKEVAEIDRDQPIARMRTLEEIVTRSVAQPRLYSVLLVVFSAAALLLAAIGIYGVMSYAVIQRTNEIGIRIALGAPRHEVWRTVVGHGLVLTIIGIAVGTASAFGLTRLMSGLLYGVSATDPLTFLGSSILLMVVAVASCYLPAHRATRIDPMTALRWE
jgi:putative ABC transport system permease protein